MATRWRKWVPNSWIHWLIRLRHWEPFNNRLMDKLMFEEYIEPKEYSVDIHFNHLDIWK